jgi:hypothetical protein
MMPANRVVLAAVVLCFGALGSVLGGQFVGEASPGQRLASRFDWPEAEGAARAACASAAPFVVLDTFAHFRPANIDDQLRDSPVEEPSGLLHGDIVAAIVESTHPDPIAYQTDPIFNVRTLASDFRRLAADIENDKIAKPAAIVSSIVLPVELGVVNALTPGATPFGERDIARRRKDLLRILTGDFNPQNPYTEIDRQLGRLRAAGVPVFVAAGNSGPDDTLNVLALSEGVFAVGALGRDGTPTSYTSAPGLVAMWSPGYVVLSEAAGGISVSGGRKVELEGAELPQQKAVIAAFSGRRPADVVREPPQVLRYLDGRGPSRQRNHYLSMAMTPGIYRTSDLMAAYGYAASLGTYARAMAEGAYIHFPTDTIFKEDAHGRLVFDPIGDHSGGQLQVADATSFAAPNICAAELFPERGAASGE